jgi:hypothetical protein
MESVYHIVTIRVNETSWAHIWRLCSHYLRTGYDSTSSRPQRHSGECTPRWPCPLCLGPLAAAAPQQASPEPLGSQEPPALSQKVPLLVMPLAVCWVVTPRVVARFEVPADQRAVGRCSCVRYDECEPSII